MVFISPYITNVNFIESIQILKKIKSFNFNLKGTSIMEAVAFGGRDSDKKGPSDVIHFGRTVAPKDQVKI